MSSVPRSTTLLLQRLRAAMKATSPAIQAYIVPSEDAHNSEYIADCDARRAFISNFDGSNGVAVVTEAKAALWTDGRYFIQASKQLDSNWTLMKMGLPDTPSQAKWLSQELPKDSNVGVDPDLMNQRSWDGLHEELEYHGINLVATTPNLIDPLWSDRPPRPCLSLSIQDILYAGITWQDKVVKLREAMLKEEAGVMVVSALDDVAWLLNLRGQDVPFNPVFFAYAFITHQDVFLCTDEGRLGDDIRGHLSASGTVSQVKLAAYDEAAATLERLVQATTDHKFHNIWISPFTNIGLFNVVPKQRRLKKYSEVAVMKSVKNQAELDGMRRCHVRDGAALCEMLQWLEGVVASGAVVTELEASNYAEQCRKKQDLFKSLSFDTISSTGPDAAIIHYKVTPSTDQVIPANQVYLIDSGAQYRDGTTDVTRTIHFTEATTCEKESFTLVLKGYISLETAVFPNGTKGLFLDSMARMHLWKAGLEYRHGTSHGVGSFLNVHEGPCGIAQRLRPEDVALKEGMVLSIEPGYYEDGMYGIRIENLVEVVAKETKYNYQGTGFLGFRPLTLVPIQQKLICKEMLTEEEITWLNSYHARVRQEVGGHLRREGRQELAVWLDQQTQEM